MFVDVTWSEPRTIEYPVGCAAAGEENDRHTPARSDMNNSDKGRKETKEADFR